MSAVRTTATASSVAASTKPASSSKPTGVMKSCGKFRLFGELPKELQKRIWEFAATPNGTMKLTGDLFHSLDGYGNFLRRTSKKNIGSYADRKVKWSTTTARANTNARKNLKSACSLSRLVVLDAWQKDVAAISFQGTRGFFAASQKEVSEGKAETHKLLSGLIA